MWFLFQSSIIASNIHWQWTPNVATRTQRNSAKLRKIGWRNRLLPGFNVPEVTCGRKRTMAKRMLIFITALSFGIYR